MQVLILMRNLRLPFRAAQWTAFTVRFRCFSAAVLLLLFLLVLQASWTYDRSPWGKLSGMALSHKHAGVAVLAVALMLMLLHVWHAWTHEKCWFGRDRVVQSGRVDRSQNLYWLDGVGVGQAENCCKVSGLGCAGVTAPQLALLETTMLKMERVDTWVLMMGGGSGVDVFLVGVPAGCSSHSCVLPGG